jgi:hypothetical protein
MSESMTDAQTELIEFCREFENIAKEIDLPDYASQISNLAQDIKKCQLLVPVVGAFSSGKSTLINNIIGADILPAAITPETSLATELHYCDRDYIEALNIDGTVQTYRIDEINSIKEKAAQYKFARLYLNNSKVKEIAPMILVDMPGFDSPLDQHNKAISEYLERGCHYIVLFSIEDGTPVKSVLNKLKLILNFGGSFSFFLSKANLKPSSAVPNLLEHYRESLQDDLDIAVKIKPLGEENGTEIVQLLKSINIGALYFRFYKNKFNALCQELAACIKIRMRSLGRSIEENNENILEMQESIVKIQKKSTEMTADIGSLYSNNMAAEIVNNDISNALNRSLEELVALAAGNKDAVLRRLNEIIQQMLLAALKKRLGSLSGQISSEFAKSLPVFENVNDDEAAIKEGMAATIINAVNFVSVVLLANPLIEIAIFVASPLIKPIINHFQKNKQREIFIKDIFPAIKKSLIEALPEHLEKCIAEIIEKMRNEYDEKIERESKEIAVVIEEKKNAADNAYDKKEIYEAMLEKIKEIEGKINGQQYS